MVKPRVLIVEDAPDIADLIEHYARLVGCDTRMAACGEDALRVAREFVPQIVLLDIGLPGMDGWQVARVLREELLPVPPVMIAISAFCSPDDMQRSADAGIDHHLAKPAFRQPLMELLTQFVGREGSTR